MNNARRKIKREAIMLLSSALELLETIADEEEEAYYNMPEGLQASERGEEMSNNIDTLQDAIGYIEEIIEELECI